jgi:hypothetical protein
MINVLVLIPEITKGMKSIGSKSLLKIKNSKSIIEHQIELLLSMKNKVSINIATGFDNDRINKTIDKYKNINIVYNDQYENTNYGKCIKLFIQQNPNIDNLFVIGSGILFKENIFPQSSFGNMSRIFILDKPANNFNIGCNANKNIEYLFYDLPEPWAECVYLDLSGIGGLKTLIEQKNIDQMYIFEIINDLLLLNIDFQKEYFSRSKFFKISSTKDINRAKLFI